MIPKCVTPSRGQPWGEPVMRFALWSSNLIPQKLTCLLFLSIWIQFDILYWGNLYFLNWNMVAVKKAKSVCILFPPLHSHNCITNPPVYSITFCQFCLLHVIFFICTCRTWCQTCADNSLSCPNLLILHPVFRSLPSPFEVISQQEDLR